MITFMNYYACFCEMLHLKDCSNTVNPRYGVTPVCADNSVKHNCYIALFLGGKELYYQLAQM